MIVFRELLMREREGYKKVKEIYTLPDHAQYSTKRAKKGKKGRTGTIVHVSYTSGRSCL